jgi:hypothetical protein
MKYNSEAISMGKNTTQQQFGLAQEWLLVEIAKNWKFSIGD